MTKVFTLHLLVDLQGRLSCESLESLPVSFHDATSMGWLRRNSLEVVLQTASHKKLSLSAFATADSKADQCCLKAFSLIQTC